MHFTVKIHLVAEGLQNALLDMSFDPAKLKVINVTEGDLLKKLDGKTQFMQQVQGKVGHINISVLRQGNVQGAGMLASVTFQPVGVGAAEPPPPPPQALSSATMKSVAIRVKACFLVMIFLSS